MTKNDKYFDYKQLRNQAKSRLQTSLQKDSENSLNQADSYPPELKEIIDAWNDLPEHIKAAIKALVESYQKD